MIALAGCTAAPNSERKIEAPAVAPGHPRLPTNASTVASAPPILPSRPVPQPVGTPLPLRDPAIANTWPPEFRQLIDRLITLFPKNPEDPAPNVQEVQRRMGIMLTERPLNEVERMYLSQRYEVSGTRYANAGTWEVFRAFYSIGKDESPRGERFQILRLEIGPKQSGFCLNPYEFAIYTGWSFSNHDTSPHVNVRSWPPAYVWGMFAWSRTGRYGGSGYGIDVNIVQDGAGHVLDADCVQTITVNGRYPRDNDQ